MEDDSRDAFRAALPAPWASHEVRPDYGIDEHVEIFDESGVATGRSFLVQLKGTDEPDLDNARGVRLRTSTLRYFREQDVPVLLVLFHAPTRRLYAKWTHALDPHYGRRDQESITVRLQHDDLWTEATPVALVEEVERFRLLRTQRLPFPVTVKLKITAAEINGVGRGSLRLAVRNLLQSASDIARLPQGTLEAPDGPDVVTLEVSPEASVVNPNSAPTVTIHHSFDYSNETVREGIAGDVVIAFAVWLGQVGHVNEAARLAAATGGSSNAITDLDVLGRVAAFCVASHRLVEALELAEELRGQGREDVAELLSTAILVSLVSQSPSDAAAVEAFLRRQRSRGEAIQGAPVATAHYNLGRFLRGRDDLEAFARYSRAAEADPGYHDRDYFCAELGGVLFHLQEFASAAHFYGEAVDRGASGRTLALWADALFYAGEYERAARAFDQYLQEERHPVAEFILKRFVLKHLVGEFGARQERDADEASRLGGIALGEVPDDASLRAALEKDALCGVAWFNLGVDLARSGEADEAMFAFLMTALVQRGDVEAWANAFQLAVFSEANLEAAPVILEAGYRANGARLVERIMLHARSQPEDFGTEEFLEAVDRLLSALPEERPHPIVRVLGAEGYEAVDLASPDDEDPQSVPSLEEE